MSTYFHRGWQFIGLLAADLCMWAVTYWYCWRPFVPHAHGSYESPTPFSSFPLTLLPLCRIMSSRNNRTWPRWVWYSVFAHAVNDPVSEYGASAHYAAPNEALDMTDDTQELTPSWEWLLFITTLTPGHLVYWYQSFGNTCWFHLRGIRVSSKLWDFRFLHQCFWGFISSGIWGCVTGSVLANFS